MHQFSFDFGDPFFDLAGWQVGLQVITFGEKDHTALQAGRNLRATIVDGKGKFEFFGPLNIFRDEDLQ